MRASSCFALLLLVAVSDALQRRGAVRTLRREHEHDPCASKPCDAHATCMRVDAAGHTCTCNNGYTGDGIHCTEATVASKAAVTATREAAAAPAVATPVAAAAAPTDDSQQEATITQLQGRIKTLEKIAAPALLRRQREAARKKTEAEAVADEKARRASPTQETMPFPGEEKSNAKHYKYVHTEPQWSTDDSLLKSSKQAVGQADEAIRESKATKERVHKQNCEECHAKK